MEKRYFSLTTQIRIWMVVIILLVIVSGLVTLRDGNVLWKQTSYKYYHPLMVKKSLASIQNEINSIQTNFQRIVLKEKHTDRTMLMDDISNSETQVAIQFEIVKKNFLGSPDILDKAIENFATWKEKRNIIVNFLLEGNDIFDFIDEGKITETSSVDNLRKSINGITEFAESQSDLLYEEEKKGRNDLTVNSILMMLLLISIIFGILLYLLKSIQKPLDKITTATDNFRKGSYGTRCGYSSNNEFGKLSIAFNNLAEKIQLELVNRENVRHIADAILINDDFETVILDLLEVIMQKTESQMGCIHMLKEASAEYICVKSVGISKEDCKNVTIKNIDGKYGLAISTKEVQYIENIREDTFIFFNSMNEKIKPREMIVIPIFSKDKTLQLFLWQIFVCTLAKLLG